MRLATRFGLLTGIACAITLELDAEVASAQESKGKTATIGWARLDGAESCIGTQELAQSVEKLLARSVFVPASAAELAIEGRVEKKADGKGFRAVLSVADKKGVALGTRDIEVEGSCAGLNEPVSLAIALMIDPNAELLGGPPKEPPKEAPKEDPPKEEPKTKTVIVRVPTPAPKPDPVWSGDVALGFALGFGWLPGVNPGAFGSASLKPPSFIAMEGTITFFAPMDEEVRAGTTVTFYSLQGGGFLCPLEYTGAIGGVRACAGVTGGFIVADGDGFDFEDPDESGVYGMVGATLRGRGTLRVYRLFHMGMAAEMTVPFIRPDFVYTREDESTGRVFQPAPVMGTLHAFAMLSFP